MNIEPWMIWGGAILLLLLILYNRLIFLRNKVQETFKAIDVYLEQRFDTLTKLAQAVARYTDHEREVMENVTKLRSQYANESADGKVKKTNEASQLVRGLHVQSEAYPDLKANTNYLHLQRSINEIEEKISAARRTYNARVNQYNTWTQQLPMVIFAKLMGFSRKELLEVEDRKKQDVDLQSILRS